MYQPGDSIPDPHGQDTVEGFARVVSTEDGMAWLEPEQTSSCGSCVSSKSCGIEAGHPRLIARRFALPNDQDLRVGERVVVGVSDRGLLQASVTAYGLPLLTTLGAGLIAQRAFGAGDAMAALAAAAGLAVGMLLVHLRSRRLAARGELTPHFIRRAEDEGLGGSCHGTVG
ncbi:MAG: SoxR reducing system RseC family protein [Magnetospirillum sp. WYHS-4]